MLILSLATSSDYVLNIIKPLYGVSEVGNHWFATCHTYYENKLEMKESTYDFCLFYTFDLFGIVGIQTDDILIFVDDNFAYNKEKAVREVKMMIKDQ